MKNYRHFLFFTILFFIPLIIQATSGACSGHQGVNCNAGPDWDGSVICNDNWRDSSVSYYSMKMCENTFDNSCRGYSPSCKYLNNPNLLELKKIKAAQNIDQMLKKAEEIKSKSATNTLIESHIIDLNIKKGRLLGNYMDYICDCVEIDRILDLYFEPQNEIPEEVIKEAVELLGGEGNRGEVDGSPLADLKKSGGNLNCPENSYEENGKCICMPTFILKNNECVSMYKEMLDSLLDSLKQEGQNFEKRTINCGEGYEWDNNRNFCVRTETCPENSYLEPDNNCYCNEGYTPSLNQKKCIKVPEHAHPVDNPTDVWLCDEGYREVGNLCIPSKPSEKNIAPQKEQIDESIMSSEIKPDSQKNIQTEKYNATIEKSDSFRENIIKPVKLFLDRLRDKLTSWFNK